MKYFAYGSNMSLTRLRERVPGAERIGTYFLDGHALRFHKVGKDGSGKCDIYQTGGKDRVYGALFEINPTEKAALDRAEGLGAGYSEKIVQLSSDQGAQIEAASYFATNINTKVKPFTWYINHVLIGARESNLPEEYIKKIELVEGVEDEDLTRDAGQRSMHRQD